MIALCDSIPKGICVQVKPDGTVYFGNDCVTSADWMKAVAYVQAHPDFIKATAPPKRRKDAHAESA